MIASFDVGIKNLGMCVIKPQNTVEKGVPQDCQIINWQVINLLKEVESENTDGSCCHGKCRKSGSVKFDEKIYCLLHGESQLKIADKTFRNINGVSESPLDVKKRFISGIQAINYCQMTKDNSKIGKLCGKCDISDNFLAFVSSVENLIHRHFLVRISCKEKNKTNSSTCCLIQIARNLTKILDDNLKHLLPEITKVKIENQLGKIATRMKSLQGMLTTYFILRNPTIEIEYISSSQKLKISSNVQISLVDSDKTYQDRKKSGVRLCNQILLTHVKENERWIRLFQMHLKKDDLADSFLQSFC